MKGICFFDFDGTLINTDSFFRFSVFAKGWRGFCAAFFKSLPTILGWKVGIKSSSEAKEIFFKNLFREMPYEQFRRKGIEFAREIPRFVNEQALNVLIEHQKKDRTIVIVSASILEWIEPWARENGIKTVLATQVELNETTGCLTGRFSTPNCRGFEKIARIKKEFPDMDKFETWAYGDSSSDAPMLELVNHPYKNFKAV